MKRLICLLSLVASPALADDGPCFELGGQGIAPCATPGGKVAVESNLFDWQRDSDDTDTISLASTVARIGIGGNTELRLSGTPLITKHAPGSPWQTGFGDVTIGAKHQFGGDSPVGLALQVTLPTASNSVGQGTWSAAAIVPMQFKLNKTFTFDFTWTVAAAPNADASGRHFAWSVVAGADIDLSEKLTATVDVKRLRDEDPGDATNQTSASLALGWQVGSHAQITLGGVAGLDSDAPKAEAYIGVGYLF